MKRTLAVFAASLALGLGGVYLVGGASVFDPDTYLAADPSLGILGLIAVTALAHWTLPALRLSLLARLHGTRLALGTAVWIHLAYTLGSAVTPGGSGGGPALAVSLRYTGMRWGRGIAVATQVFVLDLLFFAWAAPLSLLTLWAMPGVRVPPGLTLGIGACVALVLGVAVLLTRYPRLTVRSILWLGARPWLRRGRGRRRAVARDFYRAARGFSALPTGAKVGLQALQACAWGSGFGLFWALLALYQRVDLPTVLATLTLASLLSIVMPTPGASGFMEVAVGLGTSGLVERDVLTAPLLLWRVASYYAVFALGPLAGWMLYRRAAHAAHAACAARDAEPKGTPHAAPDHAGGPNRAPR